MLSDRGIKSAIKHRKVYIKPFSDTLLGTNSYDVSIERVYHVKDRDIFSQILNRYMTLDTGFMENFIKKHCVSYDSIMLPGEWYIGVSKAVFRSQPYAEITTRSSMARYGIKTDPLNREEALKQRTQIYFSIRTFNTKCVVPEGTCLSQISFDPRKPLSEKEIKELMAKDKLVVDGRQIEDQIFQDGVLLRLGRKIKRYNGSLIDVGPDKNNDQCFDEIDIADNTKDMEIETEDGRTILTKAYKLVPNVLYIGHTFEWVKIPEDHAGWLKRLDEDWTRCEIHPNAPLLLAGSEGHQVFEFEFYRDYAVWDWKPICKLQILQLDQTPEKPYNGKYKGQIGAQTSLLHTEKQDSKPFH